MQRFMRRSVLGTVAAATASGAVWLMTSDEVRYVNLNLVVRSKTAVVADAGISVRGLNGEDVGGGSERRTDGGGFANYGILAGRAYRVDIAADGHASSTFTVALDYDQADLTINVTLTPTEPERPRQVRGRLQARARALTYPDGAPFRWRGITAFALAEQVAHGRREEAAAFLRDAARDGFNLARVLAMAKGLFQLSPEEGRTSLAAVLALAKQHDMYVEVVALADTRAYDMGRDQLRDQVSVIAATVAEHDNAVLQIANEHYHPTQADALHDIEFLNELGRLVPDQVLYTLSPAADDEADDPQGEFITRHLDRGRDTWNQVRRVREHEALSDRTDKYVVSDEPIGADERDQPGRRIANPAFFYALGGLCRGFEAGCTFHCESCLRSKPLGPVQQEAARAFIAGYSVISDDLDVVFKNARWADSPVDEAAFDRTIVRAYSFLAGRAGWLWLVGLNGDPELRFKNGWRRAGAINEPFSGVDVWTIAQ